MMVNVMLYAIWFFVTRVAMSYVGHVMCVADLSDETTDDRRRKIRFLWWIIVFMFWLPAIGDVIFINLLVGFIAHGMKWLIDGVLGKGWKMEPFLPIS